VAVRRKSICNSQCRPHWEAYADVLASWAGTAHLRADEKASRIKEARQVRQEADGCPTE
jgi:hypothetical protein